MLITSSDLLGQTGSIKGYVLSDEGPLAFATVSISEREKGVLTDEEGFFELSKLEPGTIQLSISFLGMINQEHRIQLKVGQTLEVNYTLIEQNDFLEEVVISGTMKPTYVSKSPIKVDVITARQLETFLPTASSSIIDNIKLVTGVQEVIGCGVCYTNNISINGLEGAYTAVLLDGTPMYGNLASVYGLNGIPNMIIDRFEVIKGPSSTLYGTEAVAGVINIITKDPADQPILSVDLMGSTHLESFGNIAYAPRIGKSKGYVGMNYALMNSFDDFNEDLFGDRIHLDRKSFFTKWDIYRPSGKQFTLAGKYYFEDRRNGIEEFLIDRNYRDLRGSDEIYGESIYTHRAELFGTYAFNTTIPLKLDFSLSHHDQDSFYGSDHYQAAQQIAFANITWNKSWKKHDFIIGLTSRYNGYDDNSVATEIFKDGAVVNQPNNQFIPGVFFQDEYSVNDKWTILSGLRLDHYSEHGLILAPRLSMKFNPTKWTTVRSNFGTGFRIVNLFTEDHAFVSGQREVVIEDILEPERSFNLSLNINNVYTALGGTGTLELDGYYTRFSNKIIPDYDDPGKITYRNSEGFARTKGLGLTVNHNFAIPLSISLGFNVQSVKEFEPLSGGQFDQRSIEFAPDYSGNFSINYSPRISRITIGYSANITGPMALPEVYDLNESGIPLNTSRPTQSPAFHIHNIQITKSLSDQFKIYGGLKNFTNYRQNITPLVGFNDPNSPIGFSDFFDTSYAYAPIHGREFYIGFNWSISRSSN